MGVIMYILLTGIPPFNGKNDRAIIEKVKAGRYSLNKPAFKYVSETAKDLLQKMLLFDPAKRPSALQCYNHKWFKNDHKVDKKKLDVDTLANFKNFHYKTKLQRALYYFMANNLASEEEKQALTKTFKALDTNGDGVLSRDEIKKGYKKTSGITNAELDALLKQVDSNENSDINYTEFMVASLDRRKILTDARMEACFKLFDKDQSGKITIAEFKELLGGNNIEDSKWEKTLIDADTDNDGSINLPEFKKIFKQMIEESKINM
jgi:calcium-dependent protein kinase